MNNWQGTQTHHPKDKSPYSHEIALVHHHPKNQGYSYVEGSNYSNLHRRHAGPTIRPEICDRAQGTGPWKPSNLTSDRGTGHTNINKVNPYLWWGGVAYSWRHSSVFQKGISKFITSGMINWKRSEDSYYLLQLIKLYTSILFTNSAVVTTAIVHLNCERSKVCSQNPGCNFCWYIGKYISLQYYRGRG